jgi:hypothetical protein
MEAEKRKTVFRDSQAREWTVYIDGSTLAAARRDGLKLGELMSGEIPDIGIMLEMAWHGVQHMARIKAGRDRIRKDDFLGMLRGRVLQDAIAATAAALEDCFHVDAPEDDGEEDPDAAPLA